MSPRIDKKESRNVRIIILILFVFIFFASFGIITLSNSHYSPKSGNNISSSSETSSSSFSESGSFSPSTSAQQAALEEYNSMKLNYQGNIITGGSIEAARGGSASYNHYASPSAVVIKNLIASRNSGVAHNINFFMSDGSTVVFGTDSDNQIINVVVNDSITNVTGHCDITPGSYIMCRAQSADYRPISGTSSPVLVINAALESGEYLSR